MSENPQGFTPRTLSILGKDALSINRIASVVGVSPLFVAAPIARELNKTELDYRLPGFLQFLRDFVVNYQRQDGVLGDPPWTYGPATSEYYQDDNRLAAGIDNRGFHQYERGLHPTLNDIGPGKIQIGTAINYVNKYGADPRYSELDLDKYIGHYDQLVRDMQSPAGANELAYKLQALIAKDAINFFANKFGAGDSDAGLKIWNSYSPQQQAALITSFSARGEASLAKDADKQLAESGYYVPDLTSQGAAYLAVKDNYQNLKAALDQQADASPSGDSKLAQAATGNGTEPAALPASGNFALKHSFSPAASSSEAGSGAASQIGDGNGIGNWWDHLAPAAPSNGVPAPVRRLSSPILGIMPADPNQPSSDRGMARGLDDENSGVTSFPSVPYPLEALLAPDRNRALHDWASSSPRGPAPLTPPLGGVFGPLNAPFGNGSSNPPPVSAAPPSPFDYGDSTQSPRTSAQIGDGRGIGQWWGNTLSAPQTPSRGDLQANAPMSASASPSSPGGQPPASAFATGAPPVPYAPSAPQSKPGGILGMMIDAGLIDPVNPTQPQSEPGGLLGMILQAMRNEKASAP